MHEPPKGIPNIHGVKYWNLKENTPTENTLATRQAKTQLQSGSLAGFEPSLSQPSLATPPSSDKACPGGISDLINLLPAAQARTCRKVGQHTSHPKEMSLSPQEYR